MQCTVQHCAALYCTLHHRFTPNLYSEAIELVCGGSPIGCVLVECKAQLSGEWEQHQHRTSLDQLGVQYKCTVKGEMNGNLLQLPVHTPQGLYTPRGHSQWESHRR